MKKDDGKALGSNVSNKWKYYCIKLFMYDFVIFLK